MRLRPDVLLVESDPGIVQALVPLLAVDGLRVHVVSTCAGARALNDRFAVAILDMELDDGNGIELAVQLLEARSVDRVVFLAGASWQPVLRLAAHIGRVVGKDEGLEVLSAEVRRARGAAPCVPSGVFGDYQDLVRPVSWPPRA